jgi:ubiquinol-cytochrome c reductase cytochrome b subunit
VLVILVFLHIIALHEVGSNTPEGISIKKPKGSVPDSEKPKFEFHERFTKKYDIVDAIPFYPYYIVKDLVGIGIFLAFFCYVLFFAPAMGGFFLEPPNFEAANPLKTPAHIAPVWYFTPFYAILRAVPDKLFGVILMFAAIVFLFLLPWLDRCKVRSIRYRGTIHKVNLTVFVISFVVLGYLGVKPATEVYTFFARVFTFLYFAFFILLWFYSKNEKTQPVPERITK